MFKTRAKPIVSACGKIAIHLPFGCPRPESVKAAVAYFLHLLETETAVNYSHVKRMAVMNRVAYAELVREPAPGEYEAYAASHAWQNNCWSIFGNFEGISLGFRILTTDHELAERFALAIRDSRGRAQHGHNTQGNKAVHP